MFKAIYKNIALLTAAAFLLTTVMPAGVYAQMASTSNMPWMPQPGVRISLSPEFEPSRLVGITVHPDNALQFDFLIHKGDRDLGNNQKEYQTLVKYFLASLTVPDDEQWVNLSPYEKDRIIPDDFGKTEMGRDLLAQDYILKQITASLIYPEANLGKKFWDKVYQRAQQEYGTTQIPVNTFNKVWIVPDEAVVYESGNTAYILKSHLKVMMEEDYLSLSKHTGISSMKDSTKAHRLAAQVVKEIILPQLEKEVNEGKNFALLRQIYSGMILATWYKKALRESLLGKIYADKDKVKGVDQNPKANEIIYQRYLRAFKKGVFNYIKEDVDTYSQQVVPRKYFSGGFEKEVLNHAMRVEMADKVTKAQALEALDIIGEALPQVVDVDADLNPAGATNVLPNMVMANAAMIGKVHADLREISSDFFSSMRLLNENGIENTNAIAFIYLLEKDAFNELKGGDLIAYRSFEDIAAKIVNWRFAYSGLAFNNRNLESKLRTNLIRNLLKFMEKLANEPNPFRYSFAMNMYGYSTNKDDDRFFESLKTQALIAKTKDHFYNGLPTNLINSISKYLMSKGLSYPASEVIRGAMIRDLQVFIEGVEERTKPDLNANGLKIGKDHNAAMNVQQLKTALVAELDRRPLEQNQNSIGRYVREMVQQYPTEFAKTVSVKELSLTWPSQERQMEMALAGLVAGNDLSANASEIALRVLVERLWSYTPPLGNVSQEDLIYPDVARIMKENPEISVPRIMSLIEDQNLHILYRRVLIDILGEMGPSAGAAVGLLKELGARNLLVDKTSHYSDYLRNKVLAKIGTKEALEALLEQYRAVLPGLPKADLIKATMGPDGKTNFQEIINLISLKGNILDTMENADPQAVQTSGLIPELAEDVDHILMDYLPDHTFDPKVQRALGGLAYNAINLMGKIAGKHTEGKTIDPNSAVGILMRWAQYQGASNKPGEPAVQSADIHLLIEFAIAQLFHYSFVTGDLRPLNQSLSDLRLQKEFYDFLERSKEKKVLPDETVSIILLTYAERFANPYLEQLGKDEGKRPTPADIDTPALWSLRNLKKHGKGNDWSNFQQSLDVPQAQGLAKVEAAIASGRLESLQEDFSGAVNRAMSSSIPPISPIPPSNNDRRQSLPMQKKQGKKPGEKEFKLPVAEQPVAPAPTDDEQRMGDLRAQIEKLSTDRQKMLDLYGKSNSGVQKAIESSLALADQQRQKLQTELSELEKKNKAMNGGIDLNAANLNLKIKRDGRGVPLPWAQQDMSQLNNIEGFVPVILKILPVTSLPLLSQLQQKIQSA